MEYFNMMLNGAKEIIEPFTKKIILALILSNLFWMLICMTLVLLAYLAPDVEMKQSQDIPEQRQEQSYSGG